MVARHHPTDADGLRSGHHHNGIEHRLQVFLVNQGRFIDDVGSLLLVSPLGKPLVQHRIEHRLHKTQGAGVAEHLRSHQSAVEATVGTIDVLPETLHHFLPDLGTVIQQLGLTVGVEHRNTQRLEQGTDITLSRTNITGNTNFQLSVFHFQFTIRYSTCSGSVLTTCTCSGTRTKWMSSSG